MLNLDRHENNLLVVNAKQNDSLHCQRFRSNSYIPDSSYSYSSQFDHRTRSLSINQAPSNLHLIPIDHGYTLPSLTTQSIPEWCWMYWNQCKLPMTDSVKRYIRSLDIEADIAMLHTYLPSIDESALNTLRVTTLLLKLVRYFTFYLNSREFHIIFPYTNLESSFSLWSLERSPISSS